MRKITAVLCISFLGVFVGAGTALALPYTTEILKGPERPLTDLDGILDNLYGWDNLSRVDDGNDQIWKSSGSIQATAQAKFAGYSQDFGYIAQNSSSGFESLFKVPSTINGDDLTGPSESSNAGGNFVWALKPSGAPLWTSEQSSNKDSLDHMVTWQITGGANNTVGNYVIAWEDLYDGGDRDFNDLVVEVGGAAPAPVPEPATMLLFGTGLVGLAGARLRRKKK